MIRILPVLLITIFLGCSNVDHKEKQLELEELQIAFMADVHLHHVYGELEDSEYKGVLNPGTGKHTLARTMKSQLSSTRLFNENYFAFLAALDDVVKRKIKYVVLPGDFSDDGQPVNVKGLKSILNKYEQEHGLQFVVTTGNHDPVRPFSMDAGKKDFLGEGGKEQVIISAEKMCSKLIDNELPPVITKDIRKMGYEEVMNELTDFGFYPDQNDVFWETPFSDYSYETYSYEKALEHADIDKRQYQIPPLKTTLPDVSYLVEPEDGLWFLAIDANVYVPKELAIETPDNPKHYHSASIGYNNVLTHKQHLLDWVESVTKRASQLGKKLIVFSHYPMVDFNDDATEHIRCLMGDGKMQIHRVPEETVAKLFADAGVKVHFGGHMHINDTGVRRYDNGKYLVNVQIPSLAAYIPAYKILTMGKKDVLEIETVIIDTVPRFKELFPLYEMEHDYLLSVSDANIWNKDILQSSTYHQFTNWHLKELVRFRFLKNDWPEEIKDFLLNASGYDILVKSNTSVDQIDDSYKSWNGFDMIFDFYRLRSADKLALPDIGKDRIKQYEFVVDKLLQEKNTESLSSSSLQKDLKEFATIFHHFLHGEPADHFSINMLTGMVKPL